MSTVNKWKKKKQPTPKTQTHIPFKYIYKFFKMYSLRTERPFCKIKSFMQRYYAYQLFDG